VTIDLEDDGEFIYSASMMRVAVYHRIFLKPISKIFGRRNLAELALGFAVLQLKIGVAALVIRPVSPGLVFWFRLNQI